MNTLFAVVCLMMGQAAPGAGVPPPPKYAKDEHGMLVPVNDRAAAAGVTAAAERFDPPTSGKLVTDGHRVVGCVQVPIERPEGPWNHLFLWPGGTVAYEFDGNVSASNRQLVLNAMSEIESMCDANFVPREWFHTSWIHVQSSTANNAPVGLGPGQRIVNLLNFNFNYIIIHELFHVLGMYHEQSRSDRGNFVTINFNNIDPLGCTDVNGNPASCAPNFNIEPVQTVTGVYNFASIMHYSRSAFLNPALPSGDTITVLPPNDAVWQNRIGNRAVMTFGDRVTTMRMYPPGWMRVARIGANPNGPGTWSSPFNNFPDAYASAPSGGDVVLLSGYFTGLGFKNKPMRIHAPDGGVRIGQ